MCRFCPVLLEPGKSFQPSTLERNVARIDYSGEDTRLKTGCGRKPDDLPDPNTKGDGLIVG